MQCITNNSSIGFRLGALFLLVQFLGLGVIEIKVV